MKCMRMVALIVTVFMLLVGGATAYAKNVPTLRLAKDGGTWYFAGIMTHIAADRGFFKKAGVKVTFEYVTEMGHQIPQLMTGKVDALDALGAGIICANNSNLDCLIVGITAEKASYFLAVNDEKIDEADLGSFVGNRIAVWACSTGEDQFGQFSASILRRFLADRVPGVPVYCGPPEEHAGETPGVYLVPTGGSSKRLAALLAHGVEAALLSAPKHLKARGINGFAVPFGPAELASVPTVGLVVRAGFLKEHPEAVCRYINGIRLAVSWYKDPQNEGAVKAYIGMQLKMTDPKTISVMYQLGLELFTPNGKVSEGDMKAFASLYSGNSNFPVEEAFDFSAVAAGNENCS